MTVGGREAIQDFHWELTTTGFPSGLTEILGSCLTANSNTRVGSEEFHKKRLGLVACEVIKLTDVISTVHGVFKDFHFPIITTVTFLSFIKKM